MYFRRHNTTPNPLGGSDPSHHRRTVPSVTQSGLPRADHRLYRLCSADPLLLFSHRRPYFLADHRSVQHPREENSLPEDSKPGMGGPIASRRSAGCNSRSGALPWPPFCQQNTATDRSCRASRLLHQSGASKGRTPRAGADAVINDVRRCVADHLSGGGDMLFEEWWVKRPARQGFAASIGLPTVCSGCGLMPSTPVSSTHSKV